MSGVPTDDDRRQRQATAIELDLQWFSEVLGARLDLHFEREGASASIDDLPPPEFVGSSDYTDLLQTPGFGVSERIVLLLALIPHIRPHLLDLLFIQNKTIDRGFSQFGGWTGGRQRSFVPTGETAAFILADGDLEQRFDVMGLFESKHPFAREQIVLMEAPQSGEPVLSGPLRLGPEWLVKLTSGLGRRPDFGSSFPARRITTNLGWADLVLAEATLQEVAAIKTWIEESEALMADWGLERVIKPGYRALFYGPPGTGKSLTATLLGVETGVDVYRIDLSMVVSKYIGETEKNLATVFDQAERQNWLLFFDEADALFGRRTTTTSSNDRYANQEVAYLLQRIEDFPRVVILASNMKHNIDEAFARRFQASVYFPMPDADQRHRLWEGMFPDGSRLADGVDLRMLAAGYELSGGDILNVVRHAAVSALQRGAAAVSEEDLLHSIARELRQQGRHT